MISSAGLYAGGFRCTTKQLDTHNIDCREVRYPWHPWHGQQVWIRRSSARGGVPVHQCAADASAHRRLLEIPQWMFEASVVCLLRLLPSPIPSVEALRELKELLGSGQPPNPDQMIKAKHQSLSLKGDSDATPKNSPSKPTAVVQPADHHSPVGEPSIRHSTASPGASSTLAAVPRRRRHTGGKPGGGR